jgi:hypothetical protein
VNGPELTSHDKEARKAKTTKEKEIKFMKNQNIMFTRSIPQMSKTRLFRSALALGVVALIMHVSLLRAQAYDLSSLNGRYADSSAGFHPVSPGSPNHLLPISGYAAVYQVGLYTFDGAGGFTARAVFNFSSGLIFNAEWSQNLTGTYTVNADGTGTTTLPGHRRHFVICDDGKQLKWIGTDPDTGIVVGGSMVKQ